VAKKNVKVNKRNALSQKASRIKGITKSDNERAGGSHCHWIEDNKKFTSHDGWHSHLFLIAGKLQDTSCGGEHRHVIESGRATTQLQGHYHDMMFGDDLFITEIGGNHEHDIAPEALSDNDMIDRSGEHRHFIEVEGVTYESVISKDVLSVEIRKSLNIGIQSVMMTKDIFLTFEKAAQKAEALGLELKKFEERTDAFVFTQMDESNFKEMSLQIVELEAGVTAVIGLVDVEEDEEQSVGPSAMSQNPEDIEEVDSQVEVDTADEVMQKITLGYMILSKSESENLAGLKDEFAVKVLALKTLVDKTSDNIVNFCNDKIEKAGENNEMISLCDRVIFNVDTLDRTLESVDLSEFSVNIEKELLEEISGTEEDNICLAIKMINDFVGPVAEIFKDTSFDNFHLLLKSTKLTTSRFLSDVVRVDKGLLPTDEMTRQELRESQEERAEEFGIEVVAGSALTFPKEFPEDLSLYGDPVNIKFPFDTKDRAANGRVRFKQFADQIYAEEKSKQIVHERIVRKEIEFGIVPVLDKSDPLDALLPQSLFDSDKVEVVESAHHEDDEKINKSIFVPIYKQTEEERTVFGIVLEPDVVDLHGDTYDEETVKNAAHFFMENFQNIGLQHKEFVNEDVKIIESFLAPSDLKISTPKGDIEIRKNTWLMKVRILDEQLWTDVKSGKFTGFSIGAIASVTELE